MQIFTCNINALYEKLYAPFDPLQQLKRTAGKNPQLLGDVIILTNPQQNLLSEQDSYDLEINIDFHSAGNGYPTAK